MTCVCHYLIVLTFSLLLPFTFAQSPITVKNVTLLGSQLNPDVTSVSRDGGYSALINGNIVWLYDDTECKDLQGKQLSFVSNTAAYQADSANVSRVNDFGVVRLGKGQDGSPKTAILAGTSVGTGGWIPFQSDELDFNKDQIGKERVAIWPGTSPTSISTSAAFLFAPLVYVDYKPQDPSKEYQARGMTIIAITAPDTGPIARRQGDLIIPGTEIPYGGFSSLMGFKSTSHATDQDKGERDVYLIGLTDAGLHLARAGINDLTDFSKYTFWRPRDQNFSADPPKPTIKDTADVYVPGSFTSGNIFYSPYFQTFIMIYFNKMVDSTFYARYLQLNKPLGSDPTWAAGGKNGKGIIAEDVEALVKYHWSDEQKLYKSPTGKGGFNYAGNAHPEYFNTQYFPRSLYSSNSNSAQRRNAWYGSSIVSEEAGGGDGKNILLSWTSQLSGGLDNGIYQIELALLTFDDIPPNAKVGSSSSSTSSATTSSTTAVGHTPGSIFGAVKSGAGARLLNMGIMCLWSDSCMELMEFSIFLPLMIVVNFEQIMPLW
ncbi:hypothetical protein ACLMJK_004958 [Lecanora helva]